MDEAAIRILYRGFLADFKKENGYDRLPAERKELADGVINLVEHLLIEILTIPSSLERIAVALEMQAERHPTITGLGQAHE